MSRILVCIASLSLGGCSTALPVARGFHVDADTGPSCANVCKQVGMKVSAIVFIGSMGGCVCEPEAQPPRTGDRSEAGPRPLGSAGVTAGGAALVLMAASQQQQQQQQSNTGSASSASHH